MAAAAISYEIEQERLEALYRTELLDTPREPEFDELVEIAAAICGAPMSLVSLVDADRQWFKAAIGFEPLETSREVSFCAHAILQSDIFIVEDATQDDRFRDNALVTAENGIRFYAGVPVSSPDGHNLGSLCVIDSKPRHLNPTQEAALRTLARQVNARIELRMKRLELNRALAAAEAARTKLAAADRLFKAFMNSGPFISFLKDPQGRYLSYNQPFANQFNISLTDWLGKTDFDTFPREQAEVYHANDLDVLASGRSRVLEEDAIAKDGTVSCWRSYKFPCPSDVPGVTLLGGISMDITEEAAREAELRASRAELEEANKLLKTLAATDPLTNLANRRIFDERLRLEFARSRRKKLALSVLMLDVDNFKKRNDTFGHDAGDKVLVQLADLLRRMVRESDLAARYGGEEFIVLLPECDEAQAVGFAERILQAIRDDSWPDSPVQASIGVAALNDATPDERRLVTLADEALYAAKRGGKDRVVGYGAYHQKLVESLLQNPPAKPPVTSF